MGVEDWKVELVHTQAREAIKTSGEFLQNGHVVNGLDKSNEGSVVSSTDAAVGAFSDAYDAWYQFGQILDPAGREGADQYFAQLDRNVKAIGSRLHDLLNNLSHSLPNGTDGDFLNEDKIRRGVKFASMDTEMLNSPCDGIGMTRGQVIVGLHQQLIDSEVDLAEVVELQTRGDLLAEALLYTKVWSAVKAYVGDDMRLLRYLIT